jgi:hypothetical protein
LGEAIEVTPQPATYHRLRFPTEIISHAVWLYHVFSLGLSLGRPLEALCLPPHTGTS